MQARIAFAAQFTSCVLLFLLSIGAAAAERCEIAVLESRRAELAIRLYVWANDESSTVEVPKSIQQEFVRFQRHGSEQSIFVPRMYLWAASSDVLRTLPDYALEEAYSIAAVNSELSVFGNELVRRSPTLAFSTFVDVLSYLTGELSTCNLVTPWLSKTGDVIDRLGVLSQHGLKSDKEVAALFRAIRLVMRCKVSEVSEILVLITGTRPENYGLLQNNCFSGSETELESVVSSWERQYYSARRLN